MKKCSVWWCEKKHYAKGYCHTHFVALKRYGSPFGMHSDFYNNIINVLKASRRVSEYLLDILPKGYEKENEELINDITLILNNTKEL